MFVYSLFIYFCYANGFGIGAVSSIETESGSALGKFRSSATEPKVSDMAHCTQCYVTRQLSERSESENGKDRNFIAESVTRN